MTTGALKFLYPEHLMLLYASGGAGKSTLLAQLAIHVHKHLGMKTRIVGADGGGVKPFKILIDRGIVEYWPIDQWDQDIWTTFDRATKGWWPENVEIPNSKLQPPFERFDLCPFCDARLKTLSSCAACKKAIPAGTTMKSELEALNGFDQVGAVSFESVASISFMVMDRLKEIEKSGGSLEMKDGDFQVRQNALHHYGIAQSYLQKWIGNTRRLPVWCVAWTTLELRGNDDGYGKPLYGPHFPGKKLTALCAPWFTDMVHLELEEKAKDEHGQPKVERVMYLANHYPPDTKPYHFVAKTSVNGMPTRIECPLGQNNMTEYFAEVEKAYKKQEEELGL